jgi:hypothetical protein
MRCISKKINSAEKKFFFVRLSQSQQKPKIIFFFAWPIAEASTSEKGKKN